MNKILFILCLLITPSFAANTVYINDQLEVPLRSNKTLQSNILKMLPSGAKLEILRTDNDGWSNVKINNITGWILSRYLMNQPSAREQLVKVEHALNSIKIKHSRLNERFKEMQSKNKKLTIDFKKVKIDKNRAVKEIQHIQDTYKTSLKLEHNNQKLKQEIIQLKSESQLLKQNLEAASEQSSRNWFMLGAFILFLGILIGFLLIKFSAKKRPSNYI